MQSLAFNPTVPVIQTARRSGRRTQLACDANLQSRQSQQGVPRGQVVPSAQAARQQTAQVNVERRAWCGFCLRTRDVHFPPAACNTPSPAPLLHRLLSRACSPTWSRDMGEPPLRLWAARATGKPPSCAWPCSCTCMHLVVSTTARGALPCLLPLAYTSLGTPAHLHDTSRRRPRRGLAGPISLQLSFVPHPAIIRSPAPISKEDMSATVRAVILAGGETKNPLTRFRAMPAVPLGSSLLMVDVPLNNCLNAGINKM